MYLLTTHYTPKEVLCGIGTIKVRSWKNNNNLPVALYMVLCGECLMFDVYIQEKNWLSHWRLKPTRRVTSFNFPMCKTENRLQQHPKHQNLMPKPTSAKFCGKAACLRLVWNHWSVWTAQFSWQHSGRFASSCGKKLWMRARAALNLKDIQIPDIPDEHIPTKEANFVGCYFCYVVFLRSVTVWNKPTWTQQGRPGDESCKKNGSWLPISCLMLTWICGVEGRWFFKNNQGCIRHMFHQTVSCPDSQRSNCVNESMFLFVSIVW